MLVKSIKIVKSLSCVNHLKYLDIYTFKFNN